MQKKRIVVTGIGVISPVGVGKTNYWNSLVSGVSGVGRITHFDPTGFDVQIAAEVKGFDVTNWIDRKESRRMDRFVHFGVAAALDAIEDAGLKITPANAERVGVLVGSGIGGLQTLEDQVKVLIQNGPSKISPFLIPMMIADMASGHISIITGAKGPNSTVVTACATGAHALGDSLEIIRRGAADVMICGGTEAAVTQIGVAGFGTKASRPFEAGRDGFVIGEGAGVVVLESLEHAEARGAHIYCELGGYGMSGDAYHMTQPAAGGEGVARAMIAALKDADVQPEMVGYINAHGTSTPLNDKNETAALKTVFGDHAYKLAVSSTKSMTGHLLGGAGGIEAIAAALAIHSGVLPPTINYDNPDPDCDLDYVPNVARNQQVEVAVSNNSGFGGHNAVIVMKRYTG